MNITYQERQELNALSQKAFGSSSKWKKLVESGYYEIWARDRQAMVTGPDGKMDKRTFTDKKHVTKYPTVEEVRTFMTDEIAKREAAEAASAKFAETQATLGSGESDPKVIVSNSSNDLIAEPMAIVSPQTYEALKATLGNE